MSKPELPETRAWYENVAYWECPLCSHVEELGSGVLFNGDEEATCEKCKGSVWILEPKD